MKTQFGKADAGQRSRTGAGHDSVSVTVMKRKATHKKHRSRPISQPRRNFVGCRIQHGWKDGDEPLTQWKGTVLDQANKTLDFCIFEAETHGGIINHLGDIFQISLSLKIMESRLLAKTDWHPAEDEIKKILSFLPCFLCLLFFLLMPLSLCYNIWLTTAMWVCIVLRTMSWEHKFICYNSFSG